MVLLSNSSNFTVFVVGLRIRLADTCPKLDKTIQLNRTMWPNSVRNCIGCSHCCIVRFWDRSAILLRGTRHALETSHFLIVCRNIYRPLWVAILYMYISHISVAHDCRQAFRGKQRKRDPHADWGPHIEQTSINILILVRISPLFALPPPSLYHFLYFLCK